MWKLTKLSSFIFIIPYILLAGCQSVPKNSDFFSGNSDETFVMNSLADEECRYRQTFNDEYKAFGSRQFEIYCGQWEYPSGHVFEVPVTEVSTIEQWSNHSEWKDWIDRQMVCEAGQSASILKNIAAQVLPCKLSNGNWPYMAIITKVGNSIYLADGIPTIMPVLEDSIGQISGKLDQPYTMTADTRSLAMQKMRKIIKWPVYGSRDLMEYHRLMSAGQFYNSIKDYTTSALRYRKALTLHEKTLGEGNLGIVDPLMHLALEMSNQGNFTEANSLFKRAEHFVYQSPDRSDLARFLSYRALHAANSRDFEQALEFASRATSIRKSLIKNYQQFGEQIQYDSQQRVDFAVLANVETPTIVDIVQSLYVEASMLVRLGKTEKAEQVLREAKSIMQRTREVPASWEPEIEGLIARIARAKGAENERSQHLKVATKLWEDFAPGERPSAINFLKLGDALRVQGRTDDAMDAFRNAVKLVKARNASLSYDQLLPYFTTTLELAEQRPDEKNQLYAEIFTAGQLIRSELTTQNIALAIARLSASKEGADNDIRDYQEAQDQRILLHRAYDTELSKLADEHQAETLEQLKQQISNVETHLEQLSKQVQAAFPRYNQLVDSAIDAETVVALIKPDEVLLQVLFGIDDGVLFVVTNEKVKAIPIDISLQEAQELVDKLRSGLELKNGRLQKFDVSLAHLLYQRLFSQVIDDISDKHLITVSTGSFLSLPFGVLVTEDTLPIEDKDYSDVAWLAKSSPISLLPSVRSFVGLRNNAQPSLAEKAFIGFGDFIPLDNSSIDQLSSLRSGDCQGSGEQLPSYQNTRSRFNRLPSTKLEISEVAKAFSDSTVNFTFGADFTDQAVKDIPLHEYQVLYFATHGLLPNELECQPQPSLVTSSPRILSGKNDGFLDMEEILQLRLDADLVVLSACNTGGPDKKGGENLSGLARAFFFAGARSLLVSHWPAADVPTVKLMIDIFSYLRENSDVGLAKGLQNAQIEFLEGSNSFTKNYSHPIFWANFTVVGDGKKGLKIF